MDHCATSEVIMKEQIGIGSDIFLVGLFRNHLGQKMNIPIMRVGNIAAMPEEPIRSGGKEIQAFLIEARSIGGLSGSPVFVMTDMWQVEHPGGWIVKRTGRHYLLGIMHGHFNLPTSGEDSVVDAEVESDDTTATERINTGIGIVIPAEKILEVINQPKLMELRRVREQEARDASAGTPDSA
jgi:hypothetical protein